VVDHHRAVRAGLLAVDKNQFQREEGGREEGGSSFKVGKVDFAVL